MLVGITLASEEEDVPDMGVEEEDEELALDQEVLHDKFSITLHARVDNIKIYNT